MTGGGDVLDLAAKAGELSTPCSSSLPLLISSRVAIAVPSRLTICDGVSSFSQCRPHTGAEGRARDVAEGVPASLCLLPPLVTILFFCNALRGADFTVCFLSDSSIYSALVQNKLEGLVAQHMDVLESLTPKVLKRVNLLRDIQVIQRQYHILLTRTL